MEADFFQNFEWSTFDNLREAGMAIVLLLATVSIMLSMLRPTGGDVSSVFIRSMLAIFVLVFFKSLIEGAKDFMWSVETSITNGTAIEYSVHSFLSKMESAPYFSRIGGALNVWFGSVLLTIATGVAQSIFDLYNIIWVVVVIAGPFVVPLLILEELGGIFKIYINVILALLLARIPWAVLTLMVDRLDQYVQQQSTSDVRAFFLFVTSLFIIAVSPIATVLCVVKGGSLFGHLSNIAGQGASGAGNLAIKAHDKFHDWQQNRAPNPISKKAGGK